MQCHHTQFVKLEQISKITKTNIQGVTKKSIPDFKLLYLKNY